MKTFKLINMYMTIGLTSDDSLEIDTFVLQAIRTPNEFRQAGKIKTTKNASEWNLETNFWRTGEAEGDR